MIRIIIFVVLWLSLLFNGISLINYLKKYEERDYWITRSKASDEFVQMMADRGWTRMIDYTDFLIERVSTMTWAKFNTKDDDKDMEAK